MPKQIISLVILLQFFLMSYISVSANEFLLPKNKPSVFKKIEKKTSRSGEIIPIKKPILKSEKKNDEIKKPELKKEDKKIKNEAIKKDQKEIEKKEIVDKEKVKLVVNSYVLPRKKPKTYKTVNAVEKSKILSQKDFDRSKLVFENFKSKKWITGYKISKKIKDDDFRTYVQWLYLLKTGNNASFSDYQIFIKKNSDYPRIGRLQYLAERKIYLKNSSPKNIISWFEEYPPVSGLGKLKLAEALVSINQKDGIKKIIQEGWTIAELTSSELRYYRSKFKSFLSSDDHIRRAQYLAWERKYWDLKRVLKYLPTDERALYNARQILMSNSYGVDNAISKVPAHLKKDIGLQYDRLRWRARRGRLESSLEILYENSNKSEDELVRADLWWKQRESVVRSLLYKKRFKTAYKVASEHSLSSGPEFAEAEWLSGWIAHSFLNSQEYAINHFLNFYDNVSYPISLARGAYWLGSSYKALGEENNSKRYYKEGAKFLTTYYGQLSFNEISKGEKFELSDDTYFSKDYEKEFNKNKLIKIVKILSELDQTKYSKDVIKFLATLDVNNGSEVLAAKLATEIGRYDYAIQISKRASYEKRFYLKYNYPIISTPRKINDKVMPSSDVILAIIRQESEFDSKANSYAGARGMMQLMKYTAKLVAKQAKLPYSISGLTRDADYNIKLGSYYFNSLMENYTGIYPFAIAAYNAGPNRVKTWRRVNGDPSKKQLSYIDWIELIRFEETRNYVQRVLENVNVYRYMISQQPVTLGEIFK